ncbi:serine hydrolase domain-containing protein [Humibacter sp.]|uniref:serine hydrolase domain-containing protein n=1 Tax=Humibacter sp. TaxID=1940291 RepID=UPI003F7E42EF
MPLNLDNVWRSLDERVASGWAPGVVAGVRHRGQTQFYATGTYDFAVEAGSVPMTENTPFRIASLSKIVGMALTAQLIGDGLLELDDEIAEWMPELADRRVLRSPDAALDDTVAAEREITVRDLLTFTSGMGLQFESTPYSRELNPFAVGPLPPPFGVHEYLERIAALPLAHQPGERWMYHTSSDVLGILLSRVSEKPLHELLLGEITGPLGLSHTGFFTEERLPSQYWVHGEGLEVSAEYDRAFSAEPAFESLGGGLVSTVPEFVSILTAIAEGDIVPAELVPQATTSQLDAGQQLGLAELVGTGVGWGWCTSVETGRPHPWSAPGRWGWTGGSGTSAYVDPSRDLIGVVMSQRFMTGPQEAFDYFWGPLAASVDGD